MYNDIVYKSKEGLTMGNPLSSLMAELLIKTKQFVTIDLRIKFPIGIGIGIDILFILYSWT